MKKSLAYLSFLWFLLTPSLHANLGITSECEDAIMKIVKMIDWNNWGWEEPYFVGIEQVSVTGEVSNYNHHVGMPILSILVRYEESAFILNVHPGSDTNNCLISDIKYEGI